MERCVIYDEQLEYSYWRYGEIFDAEEKLLENELRG